MEQDGVTIDSEGFSRDVAQFALLTGRSFAEELTVQAKGALREIVFDTPPFGTRARSVADARKASESAIGRDMHRIFRPKKLVGSRKITHFFGKAHPSAPWTVTEKEKHPDLGMLLAQHKKLSSSGRQARYRNAYFVDANKYFALQAKLKKRGGFLGGGFAPAAAALGVPLPHLMKRHAGSAPGGVQMRLTGDHLSIIIINDVAYASRVAGFPARVERALQSQRGKMERQIPFLLRRHERLIN
jgi:hypothetical protein